MSFWRHHYHLVWATRDRAPLIQPSIEGQLRAYIVSKSAELAASSHFVNHVLRPPDHFGWQRGYGSMSMGETQRPIAVAYAQNQKQHHAQQTTPLCGKRRRITKRGSS